MSMEVKQALGVIKQGLDIALGSGAFKSTDDVATLHTALLAVNDFITAEEAVKSEAKVPVKKTK